MFKYFGKLINISNIQFNQTYPLHKHNITRKYLNNNMSSKKLNIISTQEFTSVLVEVPKEWTIRHPRIYILKNSNINGISLGNKGRHDLVGPIYTIDDIPTYLLRKKQSKNKIHKKD